MAKFNNSKPIVDGKDYNFYEQLNVSNVDFLDSNEDGYAFVYVTIRNPGINYYIQNAGANPVEVSYNGNTLHGHIPAGITRSYLNRGVVKMWFRAPSGSTVVRIEAWATV